MYVGTNHTGLIVTDASLALHAFNPDAIQILSFPEAPERIADHHSWLGDRLRSRLFDRSAGHPIGHIKSGRRTYLCRTFPIKLNVNSHVPDRPGFVLLLERRSNGVISMDQIAQRFALTERERETVRLLFEGLTSKEIAIRMKISPHTVNAFVRLVMVKMGVSSRSGIVGKIARSSP